METNPLHALKAGVSVARCNLHMLHKQHASSPPGASDLHGLPLRQKKKKKKKKKKNEKNL